jgi:hypothetical protein
MIWQHILPKQKYMKAKTLTKYFQINGMGWSYVPLNLKWDYFHIYSTLISFHLPDALYTVIQVTLW